MKNVRYWREGDEVFLCRTREDGQNEHAALNENLEVVWVEHEDGAVIEPLLDSCHERHLELTGSGDRSLR